MSNATHANSQAAGRLMVKPIIELPIHGLLLQPLGIMDTPGGSVLHLLKPGSPLMPAFPAGLGEIYFSEVYANAVKAWKRHRRQTQNLAVITGLMQFVLYDARDNSPTRGEITELLLGRPDHYNLLHIPPGIWYGFRATGGADAILCNCADLPHDPAEGDKLPPDSDLIPYKW